jgi:spermidine synthase
MVGSRRASALAFLAAFVALFVQVLVHRMVSAKLLNNFAFLVISLTMLGFAVSGVFLSRRLGAVLEELDSHLLTGAALFAITLIAAALLFYRAPSGDEILAQDSAAATRTALLSYVGTLPLAVLFAVPFAFVGLMLGALLASPTAQTRRVYAFDLAGSAAGACAVIPAISHFGVERSALAAAAALVTGTLLLTRPRTRHPRLAAAAAIAMVAGAAIAGPRAFAMHYPRESFLGMTQVPSSGYVLERIAWDPVARIEVSRIPPPRVEGSLWPSLTGGNDAFLARFRRVITQNNNAFTYAVDYDGRKESLKGIEETVYAAAYQASSVRAPKVLVIGVGGGFDVLTALNFDAASVVGVEVNAATLDIVRRDEREYFRHWVDDPRVRLVHDEGRHFLAGSDGLYDVLQLSGVDSASGTPGAAHVFSESYIYTREAFDLYLSRLTPGGILNVMRHEWIPPREMLRAVCTAVGALRRSGVDRPAGHLAVVAANDARFTALLVKKTPFTADEVARLRDWTAGSRFFHVAYPSPADDSRPRNLYQAYLGLGDPVRERVFESAYPFDVRPVDDDRPFFFKHSYWWHLWSDEPVLSQSVPVMEYGLLVLLAVTSVAAAVCVFLPLRMLAGNGLHIAHAGRYAVFFGGIGLGYLAVEMALLQKFGLLLGHPNYALSVVLASLLVASGAGALFSHRIAAALGGLRFVAYLLAGVLLAELLVAFPFLPRLAGAPFAVRVAVVVGLVVPPGVLMGTFFPTGLEDLKPDRSAFVPWAWGLNGVFSVVAPVLSVAISMTWGISALLLSAIPLYLAAAMAYPTAVAPAEVRAVP